MKRQWMLIASLFFCACSTPPAPVIPKPEHELAPAEVARRIENAQQLARGGDEERALAALALAEGESLSQEGRRAMTRAGSDVRRAAFWSNCPLIGELTLDADRVRYGESARARLTLTHFGSEPLRLVARHRTLLDLLTGDVGERAVLDVTIERRECDANGTRLVERENRSLAIDDDIVIRPGGTVALEIAVPLAERRGMLFGQLGIAVTLRPVTIEHGAARRYDPLAVAAVRAIAVRRSVEAWFDGGLERLSGELGTQPRERPEAVLLALAGMPDADLRKGVDAAIRALPSLDPLRRRLAHGALEWILGEQLAEDSVAVIAWWDADGKSLTASDLAARRLGGARRSSGWLAGGLRDRLSPTSPSADNTGSAAPETR